MRKNVIPFFIASLGAGIFLLMTLSSSSAFNFLPYLINRAISSDGSGESEFILFFDIAVGLIIFWILFRITKRAFKGRV